MINKTASGPCTKEDYLRSGTDILAAGYCVYGSATCFAIAIDKKVAIFTSDPR